MIEAHDNFAQEGQTEVSKNKLQTIACVGSG